MRHEAFDKSGQIQFRFALVALDCAPENFVAAGEPALAGVAGHRGQMFVSNDRAVPVLGR